MTKLQRLLYFTVFIATQAIYFPLNRFSEGGKALITPLDTIIPIIPIWSIPYLLWMFCWFWLCLLAAIKMPDDLYRSFSYANMIVILSAMLVYVFYPTYVIRPTINGIGFGVDILRWLYSNDGLYNAFPSGHIYLAVLTAVFYSRWVPETRWVWIIVIPIVVLSTLLTGQHYILDIIGGVVFAAAGAFMAIRILSSKKKTWNFAQKEKPTL